MKETMPLAVATGEPGQPRLATAEDLPAINAIYNHYVLTSTCTYQTDPETAEERARWFSDRDEAHPVTVLEAGGEIVAWGALTRFRRRSAYRYTVEDSTYVRHDCRGRGLGSLLLGDLVRRARELGHHSMIAGISADQAPSIRLHEKFGFARVALLREVGWKFDRWLDVVYMQLVL